MAFKGFTDNTGPVAPPKASVSFGSEHPAAPQKILHRSPPPSPYVSPSSLSPPRPRSRSPNPRTPSPPRPSPHIYTHSQLNEADKPKPNRSRPPTPPPPLPSLQQDELQRDIEAKARRLARFKTEPKQSLSSPIDQQPQPQQALARKEADDIMDTEDAEPIIGVCSEMCPESEREERERKGDLDKLERLDGDRNLTNKSLAVKKYNRTAERDAALIRSLPVLQKTVDHLLDLLNQPYDDDFLSMHNFLWDRMRAIRMDLRMQHIFNREAITMHEQMIRFHIIAMHELCEYTTGEGFSEGFDAHLNIEQMNKTSVELFQMYDDHTKRGFSVPTEPEFRGYYALLKLDKHPGYKVETAELSLDLAKMTPEIRNTNEVLFAREVARASRAGNYIAFFRLARRATYLQACLMHAHFAKLRTQALASLHSGLQKNQGIPVTQVVKWLGMEGEDIEGLLEYHGFSLKQYEDAYMVKEGPFLNSDKDFPTKCSQLVHQKRSAKVVFDVFSSGQVPVMDGTWQAMKALDVPVDKSNRDTTFKEPAIASIVPPEEEMPDYEEDGQLNEEDQVKPWQIHQESGSHQMKKVEEADKLPVSLPMPNLGIENVTPRSGAGKSKQRWSTSLQEDQPKKKRKNVFASELELEDNMSLIPVEECLVNLVERKDVLKPLFCDKTETHATERVEYESVVVEAELEEEKARLAMWTAEANRAKLKIFLRRWKQQAAKKARNRRRMKAAEALNSLFLGPPVGSNKVIACREAFVTGISSCPPSVLKLNIDQIIRERHKRHERMWLRLDVPEIIMPILKEKNPHAKCLCWKLVTCSRTLDKVGHSMHSYNLHSTMVGRWLRAKLMSNGEIDTQGCKSEDMVILKKWIAMDTQDSGTDNLLSLSILRDVAFNADNVESKEASLVGASGLLFLLVDNVEWDLERARLQSLVRSVQPGSHLPLLILSSGNVEGITIANLLELHKLDRMRISSWSVILIRENENDDAKGFFSDDCLREGLLWLAHHAPLQPIVYPSDVRDLVLESLDPHMKALLNVKPSEVTPRDCISVFNQALERTESDIVSAAQNSSPGWPPPEINVLDDFAEGGVLNSYFPKSGWNMASNIDSIVHALRVCKLPNFPPLNWGPVSCGAKFQECASSNLQISALDEVQEQKAFLEKSLCQYLTEISLSRKGDLMMLKEVDLMVQNNTTFEYIGSRYLINPKWAPIFRRIYNWRLMLFATEPTPVAYVSRPRATVSARNDVKNLLSSARQVFISSGYATATKVEPSLNEMLEASSRVKSRGLRLAPNRQTVKDQFMQHAREDNQESVVLDKISRQFKAAPVQSPLIGNFLLEEGGMEEVNYQIPDLDEVRHTIDIGQTEGELQLDKVATEFCEKVNEQIRKTTLAVEGANTIGCSAILNPAARKCVIDSTQYLERRVLAPGEIRRSHENGSERNDVDCRMTICKPTWVTNNGMDDLSILLEQCNAVQSSIDKKLAVYFRGENNFQTP